MFFTGREILNSFGRGDDGELPAWGCKTEVREQVPGGTPGTAGEDDRAPQKNAIGTANCVGAILVAFSQEIELRLDGVSPYLLKKSRKQKAEMGK